METATSLSDEQLRILQQQALNELFTGRPATIYVEQFENDGRKRSRVVREAVESGFIERTDSKTPRVLPRVLDTIEATEADLYDIWQANLNKNPSNGAYERPWIFLASLPLPVQKAISLSPDTDWYAVSSTPYNYHATFADEPEHEIDSPRSMNRFSAYWAGPFETLDSARETLRYAEGTNLAVSSPGLREKVKAFHDERLFQRQFAKNVLWGLAKLQIVPQDELFSPDDKPRLDSQLEEGRSFHLATHASPDTPEQVTWETNLEESIQRITEQISQQQKRLALLRQISDGIAAYGGWKKFKADYGVALRNELGITD